MKATGYFVCSGLTLRELQDEVMKAIAQGWQPLGGVSAVVWREGNMLGQMFYQAVWSYQ